MGPCWSSLNPSQFMQKPEGDMTEYMDDGKMVQCDSYFTNA